MTPCDQIKRSQRKRQERIAELAAYGIQAGYGQFQGGITLTATEAKKLLRLLRKKGKESKG